MGFGLIFAAVAAMCSASSTLLQSVGARRLHPTRRLRPHLLLLRLVGTPPYAAGLALDGASAGLAFVALRSAPLFTVQAVCAANISLVALLASRMLRVRLRPRDWLAMVVVVLGIALLLVSTRAGTIEPATTATAWGLLGFTATLACVAYPAIQKLRGGALAGLMAGLSFGASAVAGRLLGSAGSLSAVLTSPATYALVLAGITGTLLYAKSLQRGLVTTTSAMSLIGQTVAPAAAGLLLLGDGVRSGFAGFALLGFTATVAGSMILGRRAHSSRVSQSSQLEPGRAAFAT